MELIAQIIGEVLDCFEQEPPTEITIMQFMGAGDWWVHTDTAFYFQVTASKHGGFLTSKHEYFDIEETLTQERLLRMADEINEGYRKTAFFYDVMAEAQ